MTKQRTNNRLSKMSKMALVIMGSTQAHYGYGAGCGYQDQTCGAIIVDGNGFQGGRHYFTPAAQHTRGNVWGSANTPIANNRCYFVGQSHPQRSYMGQTQGNLRNAAYSRFGINPNASDGEDEYSDGGKSDCLFCRKKKVSRRVTEPGGGDDTGIGGAGDAECCLVNEIKIDDLKDRIERFKTEMEDDIKLMFDRIDDRIDDFKDRLTRVTSRINLILTENTQVNQEIEDINRDVIILEEELGDTTSIQNDVILDLSEQIKNNGLYVSERWRLLGSQTNNNFFVSDMLNNGFFRYLADDIGGDVETVS